MVNVRAQSFERGMHHEATKSPRVTAPARTRECKQPSAPGEVPVKVLSDGGSTPPTSTKKKAAHKGGFLFGVGGELNHNRNSRREFHQPVQTLVDTFISFRVPRKRKEMHATLPTVFKCWIILKRKRIATPVCSLVRNDGVLN